MSIRYEQINLEQHPIYNTKDPKVWGPGLWIFIHCMASNYIPTNETRESMKRFIISIPDLLPCEICSKHSREFIKQNYSRLNEIVKNKYSLFLFFYLFHNSVNQFNNKYLLSYDDVKKMYNLN